MTLQPMSRFPTMGGGYDPWAVLKNPGVLGGADPDTGLTFPMDFQGDAIGGNPMEPQEAATPEGAPERPRGILGRISSTPGASRALIALGAGLLSGNSFSDGLAKGGMAYQGAIDTERKLRQPKVDFLANGAVQAVTDPETGKTTYQVTPAQAALKEIIGTRGDETRKTQDVKDGASWRRALLTDGTKRYVSDSGNDTKRYVSDSTNTTRRDIADNRNDTSIRVAEMGQTGKDKDREVKVQLGASKPAPPSAMAKYQELYSTNDTYQQVMANGENVVKMIETGQLPLSFAHNAKQEVALATGIGADVGTQRYALYKQFKESLRNAYLLASKGVQTDGDAERAMREIESGSGDPGSAKVNLDVVLNFINRRREVSQAGMEFYENEYGIGEPKGAPAPRTKPRSITTGKAPSGVSWKLKN